jgi:endonuclease-3
MENNMKSNEIIEFVKTLKATYPDATCSLDFETPFQIVIAVMLSAQCTDERVNKTTPALFKRCKEIKDFVDIDINELEEIIHPCGFYRNKAKNIKLCAKQVIEKFNGIVPQNMEDLLTLAGVGRKSANVILLEAFGIANGIAVDTHAKRISNRIGLSSESDPEKIEQDLLKIFPKEHLKDINHLFVWHGRNTCDSRKPNCDTCTINKFCKYYKNKKS